MITIKHYQAAYRYGINDAKTGELTGWRTPALEAAYDMGMEGIEIDFSNIVIAERYGNLHDGGRSHNYRDDIKEYGVSA